MKYEEKKLKAEGQYGMLERTVNNEYPNNDFPTTHRREELGEWERAIQIAEAYHQQGIERLALKWLGVIVK